MYKILASLILVFTTFSIAADDTYVFEAKGEFAKEMKALVDKYSKEGKIEAKVYKKSDLQGTESERKTQGILSVFTDNTAEELKYADVSRGERIYKQSCYSCHGVNADESNYNSARKLSTLKPLQIVTILKNYREDYEGDFGGVNKFIMKPQADNLTSEDMQSIAVYIYSLNHDTKLPTSVNSTQVVEEEKEAPSSYLQ